MKRNNDFYSTTSKSKYVSRNTLTCKKNRADSQPNVQKTNNNFNLNVKSNKNVIRVSEFISSPLNHHITLQNAKTAKFSNSSKKSNDKPFESIQHKLSLIDLHLKKIKNARSSSCIKSDYSSRRDCSTKANDNNSLRRKLCLFVDPNECKLCKAFYNKRGLIKRGLYRKFEAKATNIYNGNIINDIIYNAKTHIVSLFKDYLIYDDRREFFHGFVSLHKSNHSIKKIAAQLQIDLRRFQPNFNIMPEQEFLGRGLANKEKIAIRKKKEYIRSLKDKEKENKILDYEFIKQVEQSLSRSNTKSIINQTKNPDHMDLENLLINYVNQDSFQKFIIKNENLDSNISFKASFCEHKNDQKKKANRNSVGKISNIIISDTFKKFLSPKNCIIKIKKGESLGNQLRSSAQPTSTRATNIIIKNTMFTSPKSENKKYIQSTRYSKESNLVLPKNKVYNVVNFETLIPSTAKAKSKNLLVNSQANSKAMSRKPSNQKMSTKTKEQRNSSKKGKMRKSQSILNLVNAKSNKPNCKVKNCVDFHIKLPLKVKSPFK